MEDPTTQTKPHAIVKKRARVSWVWLFPILAALTAGWLFWTDIQSRGPEIEIRFAEAPGIQAGKTVLIYRGITAGKVTAVRLGPTLNEVVVTVLLKKFATDIAREKTDFWIDQPVISLKGATGLESIIQGNSIQARVNGGSPATQFVGRSLAPLDSLEAPGLVLNLRADNIQFLDRGAPVYHRGVAVGAVREKKLDPDGKPLLQVAITKGLEKMVHTTSRFWVLPATSLRISPRGASLDMAGLDALVQGGIAFDRFSDEGEEAPDGITFDLWPQEFAARTDGPELSIAFDDGRGLLPGETRVCYLGQPVGYVTTTQTDPTSKTVRTTIRLESKFSVLAKSDSIFTLVRPRVSLEGVSGLDTLITGAYIAAEPGSGGDSVTSFVGRTVSQEEWDKLNAEREGLRLTLTADTIPNIVEGAPVFYRGITAGSVLKKSLDKQGRPSLEIVIRSGFREMVRTNSRFWRVPATSVTAGPGVLNVQIQNLASLVNGGIAFDAFDPSGHPATTTTPFALLDSEKIARATSAPLRISFENGRGLLAGQSELRYLGLPVGLVESVRTNDGRVEVSARLQPGYEFLRREGSKFAIVKPSISLASGVTGIETILSGVYVDCVPGSGTRLADHFVGSTSSDPEVFETKGFTIGLLAPDTSVRPGAPVLYRDLPVGEVTSKSLSDNGSRVLLTVSIDPKYRDLIRTNTRFWEGSSLEAQIGWFRLKIHTKTLIDPNGRIAFATPEKAGEPAKEGQIFDLSRQSQEKLLRK